jgi:hypothetical protein
MNGLSDHVTGITNNGFTLTVSGIYEGPRRPKTFTVGGGANQTDTYTHNFGVQSQILISGVPSADPGANFRLIEGASTSNATLLVAPVAPTNAAVVQWFAVWVDKAPVDLSFDWIAQIEPE